MLLLWYTSKTVWNEGHLTTVAMLCTPIESSWQMRGITSSRRVIGPLHSIKGCFVKSQWTIKVRQSRQQIMVSSILPKITKFNILSKYWSHSVRLGPYFSLFHTFTASGCQKVQKNILQMNLLSFCTTIEPKLSELKKTINIEKKSSKIPVFL